MAPVKLFLFGVRREMQRDDMMPLVPVEAGGQREEGAEELVGGHLHYYLFFVRQYRLFIVLLKQDELERLLAQFYLC